MARPGPFCFALAAPSFFRCGAIRSMVSPGCFPVFFNPIRGRFVGSSCAAETCQQESTPRESLRNERGKPYCQISIVNVCSLVLATMLWDSGELECERPVFAREVAPGGGNRDDQETESPRIVDRAGWSFCGGAAGACCRFGRHLSPIWWRRLRSSTHVRKWTHPSPQHPSRQA